MLSRFFADLRGLANPEMRTDASLADVVDSASRALHQASQRHKPSAQALAEGLSMADRNETLVWLVQAFDVMHFGDTHLFDTALLLDRYYSCVPAASDDQRGGAQRKLLAAVCMALKTGSATDVQLPLRQVVTHLGRDQVPFDDVLVAERGLLRKLRFQVGTPTARDFLDSLGLRLIGDPVPEACLVLGNFLLQLTLADAPLHYRYPHAVLAASALILALTAFAAPQARYIALLEDFAVHCPEASASHAALVQCCASLHALWIRSTSIHEQTTFAKHVCQKFAKVSNHEVSAMTPPAMPPLCLPPQPPSPVLTRSPEEMQTDTRMAASGTHQRDDVEEAIGLVRLMMLDGTSRSSFSTQAPLEQQQQSRHSRCTRCGRTWPPSLVETAGFCLECSRLQSGQAFAVVSQTAERDDASASACLSKLRALAEASLKVRSVLARHGWSAGRFRLPPNREALLRDLGRARLEQVRAAPGSARTASTMSGGGALGTGGYGNSQSYVPPSQSRRHDRGVPPRGPVTSGASPSGEPRRTKASLRSASWCGHQHSAAAQHCHGSYAGPIRLRGPAIRSP
jgi:hypothetical protein